MYIISTYNVCIGIIIYYKGFYNTVSAHVLWKLKLDKLIIKWWK